MNYLNFQVFGRINKYKMQPSTDVRKEMRDAFSYIFHYILKNVPTQFGHLVNPQVGLSLLFLYFKLSI